MIDALIDWVVPVLKENNFNGSFPNYRRNCKMHIDLLRFQFSCCDQAFNVNIAKCPTEGIFYKTGEFIKPSDVLTLHCPQRFYLGVKEDHLCHWFKYNPSPTELSQRDNFSFLSMYKDTPLKYKYIAEDINKLIKEQAEQWWGNSDAWWEKELPTYNKFVFDLFNSLQKASISSYSQHKYLNSQSPNKRQRYTLVLAD